ncbi:MAG: serine hydrolase domain-containing protein [Planctomycetota bacterium]
MRLWLWMTCAVVLASSAGAQVDVDALRAFVEEEREAQKVPGLSIALVVEDQLVWSEGFGFADLESGQLATGSTVYRIGSVSKPIVATALMQLVEQGKVDLDADIRTYVPEWPEKRWTITVRHLLTHTSGIRHYRGQEFLSREHYDDLVGPLSIFKDDELLFEPGSKFSYTTYGFNIVANIVENVSGQPIEQTMRAHVYGPAWMNDTGLESWTKLRKQRARWYTRNGDGELVNAPYVDLSNKYAGGGITATVEDLARLHIAYARGKLMKPETKELMFTPQTLNDGSRHVYGLGWAVQRVALPDGETTRRISHSGGSIGATTLYWSFPDRGLALAIVTNIESNRGKILNGVLERVLK